MKEQNRGEGAGEYHWPPNELSRDKMNNYQRRIALWMLSREKSENIYLQSCKVPVLRPGSYTCGSILQRH